MSEATRATTATTAARRRAGARAISASAPAASSTAVPSTTKGTARTLVRMASPALDELATLLSTAPRGEGWL